MSTWNRRANAADADAGGALAGGSSSVSDDPSAADSRDSYASQSQLIWRRFRKHRLAMISLAVLAILYLSAALAPFLSPHDPTEKSLAFREAPPQWPRFFDHDGFHLRPFVYALQGEKDRQTFKMVYREDPGRRLPLRFFVRGFSYKLFGVFATDVHLFGVDDESVRIHLFGADPLGRDVFARTLHGGQISLSVGLVGVALSFFLGILIGGLAGYFGGLIDEVAQRGIEILISVPTLPLWMGLSAALPLDWPVVRMYFAITIILSLVGWTTLARVVRGRFLSLREEDFVLAARLAGRGDVANIFIHMLPSFTSHLVATLTLAIPSMILGETALSFLGLGMQAPAISWGVLLKAAQNIHTLALAPWLMIPGLFVVATVLAFNFVGDGIRDAADPYSTYSS